EDDISILQMLVDGTRQRTPARSERERVAFRKRTLALQAGGDRCFQQLRQLAKLGPGPRIMHALTCIDDWMLGFDQHSRHLVDRGGIRGRPKSGCGLVVDRLGSFLAHDVAWYL